jgi:hypothetical protein
VNYDCNRASNIGCTAPAAALDARSGYEVFRRFKELSEGKTALAVGGHSAALRGPE